MKFSSVSVALLLISINQITAPTTIAPGTGFNAFGFPPSQEQSSNNGGNQEGNGAGTTNQMHQEGPSTVTIDAAHGISASQTGQTVQATETNGGNSQQQGGQQAQTGSPGNTEQERNFHAFGIDPPREQSSNNGGNQGGAEGIGIGTANQQVGQSQTRAATEGSPAPATTPAVQQAANAVPLTDVIGNPEMKKQLYFWDPNSHQLISLDHLGLQHVINEHGQLLVPLYDQGGHPMVLTGRNYENPRVLFSNGKLTSPIGSFGTIHPEAKGAFLAKQNHLADISKLTLAQRFFTVENQLRGAKATNVAGSGTVTSVANFERAGMADENRLREGGMSTEGKLGLGGALLLGAGGLAAGIYAAVHSNQAYSKANDALGGAQNANTPNVNLPGQDSPVFNSGIPNAPSAPGFGNPTSGSNNFIFPGNEQINNGPSGFIPPTSTPISTGTIAPAPQNNFVQPGTPVSQNPQGNPVPNQNGQYDNSNQQQPNTVPALTGPNGVNTNF